MCPEPRVRRADRSTSCAGPTLPRSEVGEAGRLDRSRCRASPPGSSRTTDATRTAGREQGRSRAIRGGAAAACLGCRRPLRHRGSGSAAARPPLAIEATRARLSRPTRRRSGGVRLIRQPDNAIISKTSSTSPVRRWFAIVQPTIRRLPASRTPARHRMPASVGTKTLTPSARSLRALPK